MIRRSVVAAVCLLLAASRMLFAPGSTETSIECAPAIALDDAIASAESLPRLHSLLVSWRGELGLERYFHGARESRYANIKSASKSFISALVGIAIERGVLKGVDQPIASFFPELSGPNVEPAKREITIGHLLTMRSGLVPTSNVNYGAWVRSPNWVRYILSRPLAGVPGEERDYSTGNTHLLSAILTKASGTSSWAFAQEHLAKPLGFPLAQWARDPQGIYFGGNDMLMTPRQMIRFGELYLARGKSGERQIIPEAWIEESFVPRTQSRWSGRSYGYGWWVGEMAGHPVYYAWGFGGQYIFVAPSLELVIATTSSPDVGENRRGHRSAVWSMVEDQVVATIALLSAQG
jgi:CubicO group peptidase (beta-lactamase class C family)